MLYPGEFVEIYDDSLSAFEGEVSIEPRIDSPLEGEWPSPAISRVIQGTVRIPNDTEEPIHLSKSRHFAQIRRVSSPPDSTTINPLLLPPPIKRDHTSDILHSSAISIDPDGQLTESEKNMFCELHVSYDNVFNKSYGLYNGASGPYTASLGLGSSKPPCTKPKLPLYPQTNMQVLQGEADELDLQGVLVRPEDIGVEVKFTSPSFLVRKPDGTFRFVTAFNELGNLTTIPPTAAPTCNDVLRQLSSYKYIIKTDLMKASSKCR